MPTPRFKIGVCWTCKEDILSGKRDVDYVIMEGYGIVRDVFFHRTCAAKEHDDPRSQWFQMLIISPKGE